MFTAKLPCKCTALHCTMHAFESLRLGSTRQSLLAVAIA